MKRPVKSAHTMGRIQLVVATPLIDEVLHGSKCKCRFIS
jgi:hypothetical protein